MFVKVIQRDSELIESYYECQRVHVHPKQNGGAPETEILFSMESDKQGAVCLTIPCGPRTDVYVLNDEGKTIDHYNLTRRKEAA